MRASYHTRLKVGLLVITLLSNSCASYYHSQFTFNQEFEKGDLANALETLKRNEQEGSGKNRFIYYSNIGLLYSIMGKYDESNANLEKAFLFGEDYRVNYVNEAATYLVNPTLSAYRGEDHEHLMILYFKALNYLKLNRHEEALVECRRLNIRLQLLSDKYDSDKKFKRDAFIHTLMGIIYQSDKDYNNAFIAYRNAIEIYETDYHDFFGINVPGQLKKDLLNTAYWTGFHDEFERYKTRFGLNDYVPDAPDADLVFFWHNGLAPVKDEWSVNFVIDRQSDNLVAFKNESLDVVFPFALEKEKDKKDLSDLEVFRVAFPRYIERPCLFKGGTLTLNDQNFPLELSQDINQIAFYSLKQRMFQEMSKGLLRAAIKKAGEYSMRKEDERIGALVGLVNAISEKADTRNWQTLPHSIFYARVPLKAGENHVNFNLSGGDSPAEYSFTYHADKGQTLFHTFSSLESLPLQYRYY